jgi:hypothetical protein
MERYVLKRIRDSADEEDQGQIVKHQHVVDTNAWRTPQPIFEFLINPDGANLRIVGDACASAENHLHTEYITEEQNAMNIDWRKRFSAMTCCEAHALGEQPDYIFCNPPYGKDKYGHDLNAWFSKFCTTATRGIGVVALVPAPSGEKLRWGKNVYGKASKIYDIQGRVKFGHPLDGSRHKPANFGCQIVVWDPRAMCKEHRTVETVSTVIVPFYQ